MKTKQDVVVDFRQYGNITVPKGTRLSHITASGKDERYHFVSEFEWIDKNYPDIAFGLHFDASTYGINIPAEFVDYEGQKVFHVGSRPVEKCQLTENVKEVIGIARIMDKVNAGVKHELAKNPKLCDEENYRIAKAIFVAALRELSTSYTPILDSQKKEFEALVDELQTVMRGS